MNPRTSKKHVIDTVFVICLMLLFLLSALTIIAIGASIYKKNVAQTNDNYAQRVSIAYVTEKVRQSDVSGSIFVRELFGQNVLVFQQEVNGDLYNTYIYSHEGYLMELFARDDLESFYPQTGQKILKINSFMIEKASDDLLRATITEEDGQEETVYISIHSK
ncbi:MULTISPECIES: DUF4860 domain-containing protein [unclassified Butyrivibrio]|jgi:hypothetical protein|uniref:DUF4860 domain-containing protein n=1 Tax=unclassified Butyrivibrio TaxID=2639466 RepID=UPI0004245E4F|nr:MULTISPECIES: DUF4860 domain-containing protein [unclassified Butyrivibrio]SCY07798.1 protein of unknown function [Butyrivibrio sp. INlla14]